MIGRQNDVIFRLNVWLLNIDLPSQKTSRPCWDRCRCQKSWVVFGRRLFPQILFICVFFLFGGGSFFYSFAFCPLFVLSFDFFQRWVIDKQEDTPEVSQQPVKINGWKIPFFFVAGAQEQRPSFFGVFGVSFRERLAQPSPPVANAPGGEWKA